MSSRPLPSSRPLYGETWDLDADVSGQNRTRDESARTTAKDTEAPMAFDGSMVGTIAVATAFTLGSAGESEHAAAVAKAVTTTTRRQRSMGQR
jgi:hypothetical protein